MKKSSERVHIVVVGIDNPRLHHGVDSRDAFVDDDEAQGVCTGHSLGAVRRLFCIYHRLPCRWTARGECEGGNQEEEKFCLFHLSLNSFHYSLRGVSGGSGVLAYIRHSASPGGRCLLSNHMLFVLFVIVEYLLRVSCAMNSPP